MDVHWCEAPLGGPSPGRGIGQRGECRARRPAVGQSRGAACSDQSLGRGHGRTSS